MEQNTKSKLIIVGSKNTAKIEAVKEILLEYPNFEKYSVKGLNVQSGVDKQPKTLDETIKGAMNRAKSSFEACTYSIGIESGLMAVPYTKSGYMDVCVCAIFDGKEFHLGLSSAWEFPNPKIIHSIINEDIDMSQAVNKAGLTSNQKIGSAEGAIGIVTKGRLDRKEYTKQALVMALIHIDN